MKTNKQRIVHLGAIESNLKAGNLRAAQGQARQYATAYKCSPGTHAWFARIDAAVTAWEAATRQAAPGEGK